MNDIGSVDLNKIKKLNNVCNIDVNMNTLVVTYEKVKCIFKNLNFNLLILIYMVK